MRRSLAILALGLVVAAGLGYLGWTLFSRSDSATDGLWKVAMIDPDASTVTYWIVDIQNKEAQPVASADESVKPERIEVLQNDAEALRLAVHIVTPSGPTSWEVVGYRPAGPESADRLLGSAQQEDGRRQFATLEHTRDRSLNRNKVITNSPAAEAFQKARKLTEADKRSPALEEVAGSYPHEPAGALALLELLQRTGTPEIADDRAHRILAIVHPYGREMEGAVCQQLARTFMSTQTLLSLALDYARKAEAALRPADPPETRADAGFTVAQALRLNGKLEEAEAAFARASSLRQGFIHPEPVPARQSGGRVPVLELFTGTECPPCVAGDLAFDGLRHTFAPTDLVLLQYHVNIPRADALANSGTAARSQFYDVPGTPVAFLDGKPTAHLGGGVAMAQDRYRTLRKEVAAELERPAEAQLTLTAARNEDDIQMAAEVSAPSGDDLRLRFILVEDVVKYPAGNGQYEHPFVVRAFPGGQDGFPVTAALQKHTAAFKLADLRRALLDELTSRGFPPDRRPLALEHLRVVALVQDSKTRHILQAARVELK